MNFTAVTTVNWPGDGHIISKNVAIKELYLISEYKGIVSVGPPNVQQPA